MSRVSDIKRIVITGGPCGGKTTTLKVLPKYLKNLGYSVIIVPEIATEFLNNGISTDEEGLDPLDFEEQILKEQLSREERYLEMARKLKTKRPVIVVSDRGTMDGAAYLERGDFETIVHRLGYIIPQINSERYDGVFHLVTAAIGAEEFYTRDNNKIRKESLEEARELDLRTRSAWETHPNFYVISNLTEDGNKIGFEDKKRLLFEALCKFIKLSYTGF